MQQVSPPLAVFAPTSVLLCKKAQETSTWGPKLILAPVAQPGAILLRGILVPTMGEATE